MRGTTVSSLTLGAGASATITGDVLGTTIIDGSDLTVAGNVDSAVLKRGTLTIDGGNLDNVRIENGTLRLLQCKGNSRVQSVADRKGHCRKARERYIRCTCVRHVLTQCIGWHDYWL